MAWKLDIWPYPDGHVWEVFETLEEAIARGYELNMKEDMAASIDFGAAGHYMPGICGSLNLA